MYTLRIPYVFVRRTMMRSCTLMEIGELTPFAPKRTQAVVRSTFDRGIPAHTAIKVEAVSRKLACTCTEREPSEIVDKVDW